MRVITRRRVKVRVTVKRSDAPAEAEPSTNQRKRAPSDDSEGRPQQILSDNYYGSLGHRDGGPKFGETVHTYEKIFPDNDPSYSNNYDNSYQNFGDVYETYDDVLNTTDDHDGGKEMITSFPMSLEEETQEKVRDDDPLYESVSSEPDYETIESPTKEVSFADTGRRRRSLPRSRVKLSEFRSHSLPRQRSRKLASRNKYLDSKLSTSLESAIDSIGKRHQQVHGSKDKKLSFIHSLESINEDPRENNSLNSIHLVETRPDKRLGYSDSGMKISSANVPRSTSSGSVTSRQFALGRSSPSVRWSTGEVDIPKSANKRAPKATSSAAEYGHSPEQRQKFSPAKIQTFTVEFDLPNEQSPHEKRYISTSLIDVSDKQKDEPRRRLQRRCVLAKDKAGLEDSSRKISGLSDGGKQNDNSDAWKIVKHSSYAVSCDDLSMLCPDGVVSETKSDKFSTRFSGNATRNMIVEKIIVQQSPSGPQCESRLFVNGHQDLTKHPSWLNERQTHKTEDGKLITENVSTNLKTGAKIKSKTAIDFGDRGKNQRSGKPLSRYGELLRTSSETVISLARDSSSSQEAPRVSHRAASSSDLLDSAGSASPSLGRKEYRKVAYDGSTLRRRPSQEHVAAPRPEESFAWKDREAEQFKSSLPRSQNPTVTLLQKKREGHIPSKRPEYLQGDDSSFYKPSDKLYTIKREYESEDEDSGSSRRFAVLGPRKIEGVGPTTVDGVPVSLKTGVKSEYQGDWYRKMFDSLHKVKDVRYGSSGYMSEPEGYDSDFGLSSRYSTLDRRGRSGFEWDPNDTLSRNVKRYVHQPGRIEDYIPGCSSLSEKELRANPEVEYKLETRDQDPPRASSNHRYNPARMQMSKALKESGYESDSTLVFRKQSERRPENRNISEVYRQIQRGGEVPLEGLRKAAPRKPKDSPYKYDTSEVNIHYKTPVRIEQKEHIPDEELARRQEEHMQRVYEQERRKKYLAEVEDIERRRHTDNFTPLQKSPIPLNRYDDDLLGGRSTSKQVARALFGFTAQNKRELSFNKGDIISVRRQIDKNWQEGELRGIVGIFPSNYVEILPAESIKSHVRKPSEGQARARFAFQAQTSMEMSLSKGETVILTRRVDQNWYEGRVGQRRGIFPVSYVDVLVEPGDKALPAATVLYNGVVPGTSSASSTLSGRSAGPQQQPEQPQDKATIETRATYNQQLSVNTQQESVPYRALYNYKPQNEDELELKEGDIVMVMEKCDDGWYVGTSRRTSLFGTFPGNYVERVA